jgi:hypothetical protein
MSKENPVSDSRPSLHATVSEEMKLHPNFDNSDNSNFDTREDDPTLNVTPKIDIALVNAVAYI